MVTGTLLLCIQSGATIAVPHRTCNFTHLHQRKLCILMIINYKYHEMLNPCVHDLGIMRFELCVTLYILVYLFLGAAYTNRPRGVCIIALKIINPTTLRRSLAFDFLAIVVRATTRATVVKIYSATWN